MPKLSIALRVDASSNIGVGHAMRCLALIQQARIDDYSVVVLFKDLPVFIQAKYTSLGCELCPLTAASFTDELTQIRSFIEKYKITLLLLDGYQFSEVYRAEIKKILFSLNILFAVFDDLNNSGNLYADFVINAFPNARTLDYALTADRAKLLLGLKYCVLRDEFYQCEAMEYNDRDKLVVSFGGSDIGNLTIPVIMFLAKYIPNNKSRHVQILIGGACVNCQEISSLCEQLGFECIIQADNMAELLSQAKMAIAAPGSLIYELAYFQVPSVFFTIADNQMLSAKTHQDAGWSLAFDGKNSESIENGLMASMALWLNNQKRFKMYQAAENLIVNDGPKKIINEFKRLVK